MASSGWRTLALDRGDAGVRLDRVLLRHLGGARGMSRTRIQQLIAAGDVLLNGRPAPRAAWRVAPGDAISVRIAARARARPQPEPLPLDILYEDEDLIAVAKPAGQVVHPSYRHASGTLMNALLAHTETPRLLHRLDRQTSGVVLVSKHREAHAAVHRAMARGEVDKQYLGVVAGRPEPARGAIDLALDRDPWDRRRVMVRDRGGVPSVTVYERLAVRPPAAAGERPLALLGCRLVTGRMHQIRVHLAARGWPLVGDPIYGPARPLRFADAALEQAVRACARQALHAWRLLLPHPCRAVPLLIEAPLPGDLLALVEAAGLARALARRARQAP